MILHDKKWESERDEKRKEIQKEISRCGENCWKSHVCMCVNASKNERVCVSRPRRDDTPYSAKQWPVNVQRPALPTPAAFPITRILGWCRRSHSKTQNPIHPPQTASINRPKIQRHGRRLQQQQRTITKNRTRFFKPTYVTTCYHDTIRML